MISYKHDDSVISHSSILQTINNSPHQTVHEADAGVVGSPHLSNLWSSVTIQESSSMLYLRIRIGYIWLSYVWNSSSFSRAVLEVEQTFEPSPGWLWHVLRNEWVVRKVNVVFFRIQIKELLWRVPRHVRLVQTNCVEEWLIVDCWSLVQCLNVVIHVGHVSQSDVLQLLVGVGVPGDVLVVSCRCVEDLVSPGLRIVIIVVVVGDS